MAKFVSDEDLKRSIKVACQRAHAQMRDAKLVDECELLIESVYQSRMIEWVQTYVSHSSKVDIVRAGRGALERKFPVTAASEWIAGEWIKIEEMAAREWLYGKLEGKSIKEKAELLSKDSLEQLLARDPVLLTLKPLVLRERVELWDCIGPIVSWMDIIDNFDESSWLAALPSKCELLGK